MRGYVEDPYDLADSPRKYGLAMGSERGKIPLALLAFTLLAFQGGCARWTDGVGGFGLTENETDVKKSQLPGKQPDARTLELVQSQPGGRLIPRADTTPAPLTVTPEVAAISDDEQARLRRVAEQHPDVQKEIGVRKGDLKQHALLASERLERDQGPCAGPVPSAKQSASTPSVPLVLLTYYSYKNSVGVQVCLRGEKVERVTRMPKGQEPPEGDEEVQDADALARQHQDLKGKLEGLEPHGLLWEPHGGLLPSVFSEGWSVFFNDPGYGNRVLLVTFSKEESGDPEYWAIVDLTAQKVLDVGPEAERPRQ